MNLILTIIALKLVSAGCHINDVMNSSPLKSLASRVSAGCHINDVMNSSVVNL